MAITAVTFATGLNIVDLGTAIATSIGLGNQPVGQTFIDPQGRVVQQMVAGSTAPYAATEVQLAVPTTGQTVAATPNSDTYAVAVTPAGTLANLTLTIPNGSRAGQTCSFSFSQVITALALGANFAATVLPLPTAAAIGDYRIFQWSATAVKWLCIK